MIDFIKLWEETVGDSGKAPTDEEIITFGLAAYEAGSEDGGGGYDRGYELGFSFGEASAQRRNML